jgi:hypothetical protein
MCVSTWININQNSFGTVLCVLTKANYLGVQKYKTLRKKNAI